MVYIKSQQDRGYILNALLNLIPDVLISAALAYYTDSSVIGFIGILLALQIVYFLVWLRTFSWRWLLFWMFRRKRMVQGLEEALYQGRYPPPPKFLSDVESYLSDVANSSDIHPSVRTKAATDIGTIAGIRMAGQFSMGVQLNLAFEQALQEYSRRFQPVDDPEYL